MIQEQYIYFGHAVFRRFLDFSFAKTFTHTSQCVNDLVFFKAGHMGEMLSTMITSIWFLSSVNSKVCFKVEHLRELLSTLVTSIWFLSSVSYFVSFKVGHS